MNTTPSGKVSRTMGRDTRGGGADMRRCCFSDALGTRAAACSKAHKSARQYRRVIYCTEPDAHRACAAWLDRVRRAAQFAIGARQSPGALPRKAAGKVQSVALLGLADAMGDDPAKRIRDVSILLRRAVARYRSFDDMPTEPVLRRLHDVEEDHG